MVNPLKWHGGKKYLAEWIVSLMPDRDSWHLYREPFFGGGAVLFQIDADGLSEAVNDCNRELMNFWNVLTSAMLFDEFRRQCEASPFSEELFRNASDSSAGVKGAVSFFIRFRQSRQGLGKDFATPTRRTRRGMNENVSAWLSAVEGLPEAHERLKRVEIRCTDAIAFIKKYDDANAVFYCDPPYLHTTRSTGGGDYQHEMTDRDHERLLDTLAGIEGRFLLSGYPSRMYSLAESSHGWNRHEKKIDNKASSKRSKEQKTECVWANF